MIRLRFMPNDLEGAPVFVISVEGAPSIATTSTGAAAERLAKLGVADPAPLVEQAREWGLVKIHEHGPDGSE